jgi:RNA polymerase sigma-70 factor (ECF subfamily)
LSNPRFFEPAAVVANQSRHPRIQGRNDSGIRQRQTADADGVSRRDLQEVSELVFGLPEDHAQPELAEDAVQDGLLRAWDKRHQFHRDSSLETWIHRIAINSALYLLRKQRPGAFEPLELDIADDSDTPERHRAEHDLDDQLATALRYLSDFERVCFVLKHLEEWKLDEIAEELSTNSSAVKQALFRGVRKLRVSMAALQDR